ncbi:MAG: CHAD domain-containing protein [Acidimicrobiales bacterium]|jgi:CHAD domain-containing protein
MSAPGESRTDIEVEWQLDALDLRPVERWLALRTGPNAVDASVPGLGIVPAAHKRLVDVYVDTEDWRMGRAGYVLRVRRRAGRLETTLKDLSTATKGLRRRLEVTQPLPASGLSGLDRTGEVGWRVDALAGARMLNQVLEVRTRRRPFDLAVHGEKVGELALDDTVIAIGHERRRLRLTRVEVEVQPAWVDAMQPFVERLRRECGLQPATLSKFEAGLMAAGISIPGPPDLGPIAVSPDSTLGELAYRVLRREAAAMLAHVPGTRLGEDIESLHQMRVATRRMRAGIEMFAGVLPVRAVRLRAELGWLAALLGEVRDLDIQLGRFDDWTEEMPGDHREALDELADLLAGHRLQARRALLEGLDSRRYERLVSGLVAMLAQGPSVRSAACRAPAVTTMPTLIGERHRAARKAASRAKRTGLATDYHRLRIRCKRLRYSLEFASGLYDGELKGFVRQMTRLQDALGSMQDASVASARLQVIALTEEGASLSRVAIFAMGGVARQYRIEAEHLLSGMPELVKLLEGKEWNRVKSLMEQRRKAAAPQVRPPAVAGAAQRIEVAGRARPALQALAPGFLATSVPGVPTQPPPGAEETMETPELGTESESSSVTAGDPAPTGDVEAAPLARQGAGNDSTITPFRRQVAPS